MIFFQGWFNTLFFKTYWTFRRTFLIHLSPKLFETLTSDFELIEGENDISSLSEAAYTTPNTELQFATYTFDETDLCTDWEPVEAGKLLDSFNFMCYRWFNN